jgi:hypothetical protein
MKYIIDKRLLLYLTLTFIFTTIIGTLSHECGHYIAARLMGFHARISYATTWLTYDDQLMNFNQAFWFTLAGPLQTMFTGTIGLLLLYSSRKSVERLSLKQWVFIFLSLFWLRQSANFIVWVASYLITGRLRTNGDEVQLTLYLDLPGWLLMVVTALAGFIVLAIVLFKFIPKKQRFTFILSGLIGGILGYLFWLTYFGKIIMP